MWLLCFAFVLLVTALFLYINATYWRRNHVISIPAKPLVGNIFDLLRGKCCFGEQFKALYDHRNARDAPFIGINVLCNRALLIRDPQLIKRILISDFTAFNNRFETCNARGDTMGSLNLFFAKYHVWKEIHNLFTPLFAYNRVRSMFPLIEAVGLRLEQYLESHHNSKSLDDAFAVEVKEMCALYTTDTIASLAFGIEANSLANPKAEFRQMCSEVNDPKLNRLFDVFVMFFFPQFTQPLRTHLFSKDYENFMRKTLKHIIGEREASEWQRGDLIDIFIKLKRDAMHSKESVVQRPDFFEAQAGFLLLAGFDTSSSTMMFALCELAKAPQIQAKLRQEIQETCRNVETLTQEMVSGMPYLEMVVRETLRLYPPTAFLDRCCTLQEGYPLTSCSDYCLPHGMPVYISVLGLHRDEKHWPQPLVFDPERFSPENQKTHTPMTYLPFGAGPRACIGSVLGLLQVKVGLVHILKNYRVEGCPDAPPTELKFDPKAFVLTAKGGLRLRFLRDERH